MSGVLDELVAAARHRANALRNVKMRTTPRAAGVPSFADALRGKDRIAVIAEFKRGSPSQGGIDLDATVHVTLQSYESAGATAVSVLTEPSRFHGSADDLRHAVKLASVPLLMKDFVIDTVQVEHGAAMGASAVLLIARCLGIRTLRDMAQRVVEHGMTPLVECHNEAELERAIAIDEAVVGVNNRDLDTLQINRDQALKLLPLVPPSRIAVAESGYDDPAQLRALHGLADAVLIGTAFMRGGRPNDFVTAGRA